MATKVRNIPDEKERKEILKKYKEILSSYDKTNKEQRLLIRKAFIQRSMHTSMRRRTGETHLSSSEVCKIVSQEINLGTTFAVCAFHDVVEDTDYTLEDIQDIFEKRQLKLQMATKIEDIVINDVLFPFKQKISKRYFVYVGGCPCNFNKLADRLHNMRTLDAMPLEKQWKIASKRIFLRSQHIVESTV